MKISASFPRFRAAGNTCAKSTFKYGERKKIRLSELGDVANSSVVFSTKPSYDMIFTTACRLIASVLRSTCESAETFNWHRYTVRALLKANIKSIRCVMDDPDRCLRAQLCCFTPSGYFPIGNNCDKIRKLLRDTRVYVVRLPCPRSAKLERVSLKREKKIA